MVFLKEEFQQPTTFADGILGTAAGLINVATGGEDGKSSFDDFWNNPVTQYLQSVNNYSEKILPNYYSQAELDAPWYKQIISANFIGDKFLKNVGFAVGAAYSGKIGAGAASKLLGLNKARKAFTGAVVNSAGETLTKPNAIANAYAAGDAFMDGAKLTEDLAKAAKAIRWKEPTIKILGGITGAMGEARIETVSGYNEYMDEQAKNVENYSNHLLMQEISNLVEENPQLLGPDGVVDDDLIAYAQERVNKVFNKDEALAKSAEESVKMANRTFAFQVPLLAVSDVWQFGKLYAGGFKSQRRIPAFIKNATENAEDVYKAARSGKTMEAFKAAGKIAQKGIAEGPFEEMGQATISKTMQNKASSNINSFYEAKIDPESEEETISWLEATGKALADTYGNAAGWEEGFIGGLTGMLGIPGFRKAKNAEGQFQSPIYLQGGARDDLKELREKRAEEDILLDKINARIKDPEMLKYYQSAIRHQSFEKAMQEAKENGDEFSFKNAETSQFINDIVLFEKTGRIQDLIDMIESVGSISTDDQSHIEELKTVIAPDLYGTKTDEEIVESIQRQTKDAKNQLNKYLKISNDLKTQIGDNFNEEELEELTWMMTSIDDWETRFKQVFTDIKSSLTPLIEINPTAEFESAQKEEKDKVKTQEVQEILNMNPMQLMLELTSQDSNLKQTLDEVQQEAGISKINSIFENLTEASKLNTEIETINEELKQNKYNRTQLRKRDKESKENKENQKKNNLEKIDLLRQEIKSLEGKGALIDAQDFTTKLEDLIKLSTARVDFITKYKSYIQAPGKLRTAIKDAQEKVVNETLTKEITDFKSKLVNAKTVNEFRTIFEQEPNKEHKVKALEDLEKENNPIAKNYKDVTNYSQSVYASIQSVEVPTNLQDKQQEIKEAALSLFQQALQNSEDLNTLANPNNPEYLNMMAVMDIEKGFEENALIFTEAQWALHQAINSSNNLKAFKEKFSDEHTALLSREQLQIATEEQIKKRQRWKQCYSLSK